jgi:hypothetical protein
MREVRLRHFFSGANGGDRTTTSAEIRLSDPSKITFSSKKLRAANKNWSLKDRSFIEVVPPLRLFRTLLRTAVTRFPSQTRASSSPHFVANPSFHSSFIIC